MPVDLYEHPGNVGRQKIAAVHDLMIIRDAALATCLRDYGAPMGANADIVCVSACSTKQIGRMGDGGIIATSRKVLKQALDVYRGYYLSLALKKAVYGNIYPHVGRLNLRMLLVGAAVLTVKIEYLSELSQKRR